MKYKVTLNGKAYEVEAEPQGALAPASCQASAKPSAPPSGGGVFAPMAGTVANIFVSTGERVKKGQPLLIIEAMKMENEIVAPRDGVVTTIPAATGMYAAAGAALVILS